jgi:oligopeptide/dipeptide ABC transporter ATP-binding protein
MIQPKPILEVKDLVKYYPITKGFVFQRRAGKVQAVDGVSFTVFEGETLGLVGESGCGKSTLGRCILQLDEPTAGEVVYKGRDLVKLPSEEMRRTRRDFQIIFQDPYASLDPRMKALDIVAEPAIVHKLVKKNEIESFVSKLLETVGLSASFVHRYPHEFSGGQRQRIGIARALATRPSIIVCDEPISALDVSVQAQVLNLLKDLQEEFHLTYIFIAHDLSMVRYIANRMLVMYLGVIVEIGESDDLSNTPYHPYTQALLSAVPHPNPKTERLRKRILLEGDVPSPIDPPSGCKFNTRCAKVMPVCRELRPVMREVTPDRFVACHLYNQGIEASTRR